MWIKVVCYQTQLVIMLKSQHLTVIKWKISQLIVNFKSHGSTICLIETWIFFFYIGQLPNTNPFTSLLSTALCHAKSPPSAYSSFSFFGRPPASLSASYLSSNISGFKIFYKFFLFFFLFSDNISVHTIEVSPLDHLDSAPPLFKPLSPSHS